MSCTTQIVLMLSLLTTTSCSVKPEAPDVQIPMTFDGSSEELKATEIVPTLDTPISEGKNAIWCASFQAAWKSLEELAGEPISFEEPSEIVKSMNNTADPRPHIARESLYVAAGWTQEGIIDEIRKNLKQRFPGREPPMFPSILSNSFVAYGYLEANVKFAWPYDENTQPLVFTEAEGKKVQIHSFGILSENYGGREKLWNQPRILFRRGEPQTDNFEVAIDLCTNSFPDQIVVARIARQSTLVTALAHIEEGIGEMPALKKAEARKYGPDSAERLHQIQATDSFLVPDFHWIISHRFSQIEGHVFANKKLTSQSLDIAQQDIHFRLDKSGGALKSQTKMYAAGVPTDFFFDRPFLIYMKKRGAKMPYFAIWVDNAELLQLWRPKQENQKRTQAAK